MDTDLNIEASDRRSHELRVITTVCRWSSLAVIAIVAGSTYRCSCIAPADLTRAEEMGYADGVAEECRRWTP